MSGALGHDVTADTLAAFTATARERITASIQLKQSLFEDCLQYAQVAAQLLQAYRRGNKLIIFGNGGSAADAQHIAAEFVGRFYHERQPLPALALTTNSSILTAIGNDYAYDLVFARQIEAFGNPGDVAIGISTSGNAANVLAGLQAARRKQITTIALTGMGGGRLKANVDTCVCVPSQDTPRIQEAHILIGHIICELVEQALFHADNL